MEIKRITPDETKQLLDANEGYIYLDVRTVPEFEAGHAPGSKNIPVLERSAYGMQPNTRFVEIVEKNFGKSAKIITACQKGGRSMRAAAILLGAGFQNVIDMQGGFGGETNPMGQVVQAGWAQSGLPVTTESAPQDTYDALSENAK